MVDGKTMISLASLLKCSGQSPATPPAKGAAADDPGAAQAFPDTLAAMAPPQLGAGEAETAATAELTGKAAAGMATPGMALPISLRSGKTLPVLAGGNAKAGASASDLAGSAREAGTDLSGEDLEQSAPPKAGDETPPVPADAAQQVLALLVPASIPLPPPESAAPVMQAPSANAKKSSGGEPAKHLPTGQGPVPANAEQQQATVEKTSAPSVAVLVAPADRMPAGDRSSRRADAVPRAGEVPHMPREVGPTLTDVSQSAASAKTEPQLPIAPAAAPNGLVDPSGDRAHLGGKPGSPMAILHDLTSVVDRLVAAREALAPATAAITLQHGELGDLSLRFDQHRDGHLAVQLSASDPDAHRTILAAVADAGFRGTGDGQPGSSPQSTSSHAHGRGHSSERESSSAHNGSAARHDQPQQRQPATQSQEWPGDDRRRAGVFA